jgi:formylmethanofuran dehydrogenase subunit E
MKYNTHFVCDNCGKPLNTSNALYDEDMAPLCSICFDRERHNDEPEG